MIPNNDLINETLLYKQGVSLRKEHKYQESIKIFEKYLFKYESQQNIDNIDHIYESYVNLALLHTEIGADIEIIENYYNKSLHMTAQEIWQKDEKRVANLKSSGYTVDIIWENSVKKITHKEKPLYL